MSNVIDQRVVELDFDNRNFESNVKESMRTLKDLNSSLDSTKDGGSGLVTAVESVKKNFSALEIVAVSALNNITNKIINAGEQMIKSLSTDQIGSGWRGYADMSTSVGTLVAQGNALEDVEEQLEKLAWFTDETSYNFTDMVSNISKFTASGKSLEDANTAMMGIANWAALSGQNATTASRAMYQISQAISSGSMKLNDYRSIQNANMDTEQFRKKAIEAAIAAGTLTEEIGNVDEEGRQLYTTLEGNEFALSQFTEYLTSDQWFNSDVMMSVFGDYASAVDTLQAATERYNITASSAIDLFNNLERDSDGVITSYDKMIEAANELGYIDIGNEDQVEELKNFANQLENFGMTAFKSAQEARTYEDMVNSVKDAVSSQWRSLFGTLFGNYEESKRLWTDLANEMWDWFAGPLERLNYVFDAWSEKGGRDLLFSNDEENLGALWETVYALEELWSLIKELVFGIKELNVEEEDLDIDNKANVLLDVTKNIQNGAKALRTFINESEDLQNILGGFGSIFRMFKEFVSGVWSVTKPIRTLFKTILSNGLAVVSKLSEKLSEILDSTKLVEKLTNAFGRLADGVIYLWNSIEGTLQELGKGGIADILSRIISKVVELVNSLLDYVEENQIIQKAFQGLGYAIKWLIVNIVNLWNTFSAFIENSTGKSITQHLTDFANFVKKTFNDVVETFKGVKDNITGTSDEIADESSGKEGFLTKAIDKIKNIIEKIGEFLKMITGLGKDASNGQLLKRIGVIGLAVFAISKLSKIFASSEKSMSNFSEVAKTVSDSLWAVTSGNQFIKIALAIAAIGGSLLMISSAISTFANMSIGQLIKGFASLALVVGAIVVASFIVRKADLKSLYSLIAYALSLKMLVSIIKALSEMDWGKFGRGLAQASICMVALAGMMLATDKITKNAIKDTKSLLAILAYCTLILTITGVLLAIGLMPLYFIIKALTVLPLVFLELNSALLFARLLGGSKSLNTALSLLAISGALLLFTLSIYSLAKVPFFTLISALIKTKLLIKTFKTTMKGFDSVTGSSIKDVKQILNLGGLATAMAIFVGILWAMGMIPFWIALKGLIGVLALSAMLKIIMTVIGKIDMGGAVGLISLAASIGILAGALYALGYMDDSKIGKAFGLLSIIMAMVALMTAGMALILKLGAITIKGTLGMLALTACVVLIAGAILVLTKLLTVDEIKSAAALVVTLSVLMIALAGASKLAEVGGILGLSVALIALSVAFIAFALALKFIESVPLGVIIAFGAAVAVLMGVMALASLVGPGIILVAVSMDLLAVAVIALAVAFGILIDILAGENFNKAVDNVLSIPTKIKNLLSGVLESVKNFFSDLWTKVKTWASSFWNNVTSFFKDKFSNIGTDLVAGLKNGLNKAASGITSAVKNLGNGILGTFKKLLGIHSPSRVMYQMGEYIDEGLSNGIEDNTDGITTAMSLASEALMDGLNADPTIRPVIDLTEIQNGASTISSLMNSMGGYSVSGTLATDVSKSVNTNAALVGIDPFESLRATLSNLGGGNSTYNNTFNITGDNPKEIADEVSKIIQKQIGRKQSAWA